MMWGYGPGYGYGGGWHAWGPMMLFGGFFGFAFLLLVIVAGAWAIRSMGRGHQCYPSAQGVPPQTERTSRGLEILDERYARGELEREEYLQRKKDLLGP